MIDDREDGETREYNAKTKEEKFLVGKLAIDVTQQGLFQKVTWDGASDNYPSVCIISQLGFEAALELVHLAHENGLITYFSAGFTEKEIPEAVFTGVDGIGIGGAQVLRLMDRDTGFHGPYLEENILSLLKARNTATFSLRGKGAALLSRLDQMHYERVLTPYYEKQRKALFEALKSVNEDDIGSIIKDCSEIVQLAPDYETPNLGNAARLLKWGTLSTETREALEAFMYWKDETGIAEYLGNNCKFFSVPVIPQIESENYTLTEDNN